MTITFTGVFCGKERKAEIGLRPSSQYDMRGAAAFILFLQAWWNWRKISAEVHLLSTDTFLVRSTYDRTDRRSDRGLFSSPDIANFARWIADSLCCKHNEQERRARHERDLARIDRWHATSPAVYAWRCGRSQPAM